jgi:hypothetical protein
MRSTVLTANSRQYCSDKNMQTICRQYADNMHHIPITISVKQTNHLDIFPKK